MEQSNNGSMNKAIVLSTILLTIGMGFTSPAFSQTPTPSTCPPIYNGGIVCQDAKDFSVDKKIQTPRDGSYVDKIDESEARIESGRTMIFRIEVINKTTKTLHNIAVTDTLPGFVQFIKSDSMVKQSGEKITYTIAALDAKKTNTIKIETKVGSQESLPKGSGSFCVANLVEAKSGFTNLARDFVTFCIDRGIPTPTTDRTTPVFPSGQTKGGQEAPAPLPTQTNITKGGQQVYPAPDTNNNPNTGPEMFALIGLIPAAAAGLWLRRVPYGTRLRRKSSGQ